MALNPIFRFAPSPNGFLHLGHAYSALMTDGAARSLGGTMLLRIEDIDLARCKPEYDAAIVADLAWLGLGWPEPVLRQSRRFSAYAEAAAALERRGLLFPCFCSRREVAAEASGVDPDGAPLYPGTCRHLTGAEAQRRVAAGEPMQWRLDMAAALRSAGPLAVRAFRRFDVDGGRIRLDDEIIRPARPGIWGDAVIVRKDTPTSYHLSVVVDDAFQQVTHVTRGADLAAATDLQVLLQALLGLAHPIHAHHQLIVDETETKLAKSRGSEALRDLRARGVTAAQLRARLGFAASGGDLASGAVSADGPGREGPGSR